MILMNTIQDVVHTPPGINYYINFLPQFITIYLFRTNNRYNNDDEALSQLDATENDLRRRDFDRRKEEEEYRRRQERIEELQRERRVDDYDARSVVDETNEQNHYKSSEFERAVQQNLQKEATMVKVQPKSRTSSGANTPTGLSSTNKTISSNGYSPSRDTGGYFVHNHDPTQYAPDVCSTCQRVGRDHSNTAHSHSHAHPSDPMTRKPVGGPGSVLRWKS